MSYENLIPRFNFNNQESPWICDHRRADIAAREKLIDAAKEGCQKSIAALKAEPHRIKRLILEGKVIV